MRFFGHMLQRRCLHAWKAVGRHGVHSPLVYGLIDRDLKTPLPREVQEIEKHRISMLSSKETWQAQDLGAGSRLTNKTLGQAVQSATSTPKKGAFLFRLVNRFQPKNILELGSHVGIGSAYLLSGNREAYLTTIEGDPFLHQRAQEYLQSISNKVTAIQGNFDEVLPRVLPQHKWDLVVIDGNHRGEALLRYFEWVLPHLNENAWVLMDDIHWSPDMSEAWQQLVTHCGNRLTLDFFQWGAYLHAARNQKEHFLLNL